MLRRLFFTGGCLAAILSGCSKPETPERSADLSSSSPTATIQAASSAPLVDACTLLTSEEVQASQGVGVQATSPEQKSDGNLSVSQCYFVTTNVPDSITLRVVQRGDGPGARDPKQVWKETFHAKDAASAGEAPKEPPQRVEGVGEEAFWVGNLKTGGLFVLEGNRYIRIAVGGADDVPTKIQKASDLAKLILGRL